MLGEVRICTLAESEGVGAVTMQPARLTLPASTLTVRYLRTRRYLPIKILNECRTRGRVSVVPGV